MNTTYKTARYKTKHPILTYQPDFTCHDDRLNPSDRLCCRAVPSVPAPRARSQRGNALTRVTISEGHIAPAGIRRPVNTSQGESIRLAIHRLVDRNGSHVLHRDCNALQLCWNKEFNYKTTNR